MQEFKDLRNKDKLYEYITNKAKTHINGYHHYTNESSMIGMCKSKHIYLSRLDKLNDKMEKLKINSRENKRTYIFSMTFGRNET